MDIDTLITYILLFLFFVLPSILKRKKKKPKAEKKKKKTSIFGKLGDTLQEFVRELERQAREAKEKEAAQKAQGEQAGQEEHSPGSVWDQLDDRMEDQADDQRQESPYDEEPEEVFALEGSDADFEGLEETPSAFASEKEAVHVSDAAVLGEQDMTLVAEIGNMESHSIAEPVCSGKGRKARPISAKLPSHALQQAVVWSEILGKPVGLRKD